MREDPRIRRAHARRAGPREAVRRIGVPLRSSHLQRPLCPCCRRDNGGRDQVLAHSHVATKKRVLHDLQKAQEE